MCFSERSHLSGGSVPQPALAYHDSYVIDRRLVHLLSRVLQGTTRQESLSRAGSEVRHDRWKRVDRGGRDTAHLREDPGDDDPIRTRQAPCSSDCRKRADLVHELTEIDVTFSDHDPAARPPFVLIPATGRRIVPQRAHFCLCSVPPRTDQLMLERPTVLRYLSALVEDPC